MNLRELVLLGIARPTAVIFCFLDVVGAFLTSGFLFFSFERSRRKLTGATLVSPSS